MAELDPNDSRQKRGLVKIFGKSDSSSDATESVADVTIDGELKVVDDSKDQIEGGVTRQSVTDTQSHQLLTEILKELKIMNLHLTVLSDNHFQRTEVEV